MRNHIIYQLFFVFEKMDSCGVVTTILMVTAAMVVYNNTRRRHRLTRSGLLNPLNEDTPWTKVLRDADDGSFIDIVSLDRPPS